MVITLKPYAPIGKPNFDESSSINFVFRILTRYGAVLADFGKLTDVISYSDSHGVDGGSGSWNIRLKATSDNINLLKNIHPGLCIEIYCARNADPLEGVVRNPSAIRRKDTTPDLPEYIAPSVNLPSAVDGNTIGALTTGIYAGMHPNIAACLEMIRDGEGTSGDRGFTTMFTGAQFTAPPWRHPRQIQSGGGRSSDAAGAWQFLSPTWDGVAAKLKLPDFSPRSQALGAEQLIKDRGVYDAVVRGDLKAALIQLSWEWASLPIGPGQSGRYGQPNHTYEQVIGLFEQSKRQLGGQVGTTTSPVAAPTSAPTQNVSVSPTGGDPAFAGKVIMARTGRKNSAGLEELQLTVYDRAGKPISEHIVNSGIADMQVFGTDSAPGSKRPLDFGQYRIGRPVASDVEGVGRIFIPVDPTSSNPTRRTATGFHVDSDRDKGVATATRGGRGSAGCIVFPDEEDFAKFEAALQQSGAEIFEFLKELPKVTQKATEKETESTSNVEEFPDVQPIDDPYLDKCPYLLLRGVITDYGRDTSSNSVLTLSGAGYGKIYEDCQVLTDITSPELQARSLEVRQVLQQVSGVSIIWYRLLKQWVENFWGDPTGWEARTRQIPFPPNYLARAGMGGTVWSNLKALSIDGFFHLFSDHTGCLVWEKAPFSSKSQSLINGRNWEDLPSFAVPSWTIISWNDRLSERGVTNFLRCTQSNAGQSTNYAAAIYNIGSIRQYGGPSKREILFPIGTQGEQYFTSEPRRKQQATVTSFLSLTALESIRWYDRPIQRCAITMRGDAFLRAHTKIEIKEDWHNLKALGTEYYIISRSHNIDLANGSWTTNLEMVRDRRQRYLGIGVGEIPVIKGDGPDIAETTKTDPLKDWKRSPIFVTGAVGKLQKKPDILKIDPSNGLPTIDVPEINVPLNPDDYWYFDRITGDWVRIGNDPIAYARKEVIPNLDKPSKLPPPEVKLPKAGTGSVQTGAVATPAGKLPSPFASGIWVGSVYDPNARINDRAIRHGRAHNGVDLFPAREGDDNLLACWDGVVTVHSNSCPPTPLFGCGDGFGNWITIALSGEWSGWEVLFGHMAKIYVSSGQSVRRGTVVGLMGDSGSSGGPHLHIELRKGGERVNPMRWLPPPTGTAGPDAGRDYLAGG
ncbi:MAG: peptidoglycan DD-metalloendopeptidase family protein [Microcoleus sp.]